MLESKVNTTMNSARQIFAIAVDCVQSMSTLAKEKAPDSQEYAMKLENYKLQLGKYQGMLLQDIKGGSGAE